MGLLDQLEAESPEDPALAPKVPWAACAPSAGGVQIGAPCRRCALTAHGPACFSASPNLSPVAACRPSSPRPLP